MLNFSKVDRVSTPYGLPVNELNLSEAELKMVSTKCMYGQYCWYNFFNKLPSVVTLVSVKAI